MNAREMNAYDFAEAYFPGVAVDRKAGEIRFGFGDMAAELRRRFSGRTLERFARFCEQPFMASDSPVAVAGEIQRPFGPFLLEQINLALSGGSRPDARPAVASAAALAGSGSAREEGIQFAGVWFTGVVVDQQAKEVRIPKGDVTAVLDRRFTRRELDKIATFCEQSIVAKDSPTAVVEGIRQPFALFLLGQVRLVLAGGAREY